MKGFWYSTSIIPITLSFIFLFEEVLPDPTRHSCRPEQRDALVNFKNEFKIGKPKPSYFCINGGYPKTKSWGNKSECCKWEGITCNAKSGEVIELDLSCSGLHGQFHSNSSLFRLQSLNFLDLSFNDLNGQIPSSIDNLSHLTSLNLSDNQFSGQLPSSIGDLSRLTSLELSYNQFSGQLPTSIGDLSHLTSLHLLRNNFSGRFPSSIGNLFHLTSLELWDNYFNGQLPSSIGNLSQLTFLHLYDNEFSGQIPSSIGNLTQLTSLSLSNNQFFGQIPYSIGNLTQLTYLQISGNNLVGEIPSSFGNLNQLTNLYVDSNKLSGNCSIVLLNMTELSYLGISDNHFSGALPHNINSLSKLEFFDASHNAFTGTIPSSLFTIPSLTDIDLSDNQLNGTLEFRNISNQHGMEILDISNNKIKGQVPGWLWTLPILEYVNLSNNTFTGFENSSKKHKLPVRTMMHLLGSNNNFTGKIPTFICSLQSLRTLDLSDNNFTGSIPPCMGNLKRTLSDLNLRHNNLNGVLPEHIFENLRSLDVGHNQLAGKLPRPLIHFSTLEVLNVESNRINDTFPFWLSSLQKLQVLVLRSIAFHGPIDQASFPKLRIIDISHNHFNGSLPPDYFVKWSAMSTLGKNEDGSDKNYMGDFMTSGYYHDSMVLINKGVELELVLILTIYTALDFSGNKFEGKIPESVGVMKELHVLNLSNNGFTGHIPSSMGNLTALESLDVSQNKLSGEIPQELGNLSFLAYMNFSHNKLTGLVPGGIQFRTQPCSSFKDNLGLFGPSLDNDCRDIHTPSSHQQHETPESEKEEEEVLSWTAAAIGFGHGIAFGLTIGYMVVSYEQKWFMNPFGRNISRRRSTTTH